MLLVYTLSHANAWGWFSSETLGYMVVSVLVLVGFIYNESVVRHPLMPLSFFKIGNIAPALSMQLPITASLFAMFFFLTIFVQSSLHYTPLETGFAFLPVSLIIGTVAILAPRVIKHFGYKPVLVAAPLFLALGLYLFTSIPITSSYISLLPGLLIMPIGLGLSFVAITIAATSGVPGHESGLASGLLTTAQQIGGALGLAVLSGIASSATIAASITMPMPLALIEGFHAAFVAGMYFALLASFIALVFLKQIKPSVHERVPSAH